MSEIGNNILRLRKENKLSREELSILTGIPDSTIRCLERSKSIDIQIRRLKRLAWALDVPLDDLLEISDKDK